MSLPTASRPAPAPVDPPPPVPVDPGPAAGRDPATLEELAGGFRLSQLVSATAELRIADHLAGGPMTAQQLADALGADGRALRRLLWALAGQGILDHRDGRYALTAFAERLRDVPGSARAMVLGWRCLPEKYEAFAGLAETVRTGRAPFVERHGDLYSHFERHPEAAAAYDAAMDSTRDGFTAVGRAHDFRSHRLVVDVGGGHGGLAIALLEQYPHLRAVVFDLPDVAAEATRRLRDANLAARATAIGGDVFARVPDGADAYVLSTVLRCFGDDDCRAILRRCREAIAPDGVLIAVEMVHPGRPWAHPAGLADLDAMVLYGGADRTAGDWYALLDETGFALQDIVPTAAEPFSLVRARPVPDPALDS